MGRADADGIARYYGLRLRSGSSPSSETARSSRPDLISETPEDADDDLAAEDNADSESKVLEDMIRALPDQPTAFDANQIRAVREKYNSLSDSDRYNLNPELYQRMINSVTAYENTVRQVRIAVRDGSQLSIDRFNGRLLNVETTAQRSGNVTVVSVMFELELYIDPNAPEQYKNEGVITYCFTAPNGRDLRENDDVPNRSVITVLYNETVLDSLVIFIA